MTAGWRGWLRDAAVVIGSSLVTFGLHHAGLLDRFETTGLDAFNVLKPARDSADLVVIGIQDADYMDPGLFDGTSPLKCEPLRRILDAIAAGRPSVIGVDLDTSSNHFTCLATGSSPSWPPVVWARDAIWNADTRHFTPQPVLGQPLPVPALRAGMPAAPPETGIAVVPQEWDGVIRWYRRELPLGDGRYAPSFPWAVVDTACRARCDRCCAAVEGYRVERERKGEPVPLRLNFAGERFTFTPLSVRDVLSAAEADPGHRGWSERGPLVGKIVLLGGHYRAARDMHVTPIGSMSGAQIMAQAIQSELGGGGIRTINEGVALTLDVLLGFLLVLVHRRLHHRVGLALAISLGVFPFLCLLASYVAFSTFSLWFNFAAVVTSVLIDQLYRRVIENQRHLP